MTGMFKHNDVGTYSRRQFLQTMALGSAGVFVGMGMKNATSSPPWISTAAKLGTTRRFPNATFFGGKVLGSQPSSLQIAHENDGSLWVVVFAEDLSIWKGVETSSPNVIEVGDNIFLRGRISGPKHVTASRIWDNIAWRKGVLTGLTSNSLTLSYDTNSRTVLFDKDTIWFSSGTPFENYSGKVKNGYFVRALGVVQKNGALLATRVWTAA